MPANISYRVATRLVIVLCAVFCTYSIILASFPGPLEIFRSFAASSKTTTTTSDQTVVRKTDLRANDIVVDPNTQTLYVTVPSDDLINGNKIAPLNPFTGAIGTGVFVGSDPNKMVISDNGQFIYVNFDGATGIRRFDVTNQTAGLHINLGFNSSGEPLGLLDFAVQPGQPGTVAISRISSANSSIGIFDDGVQRPGTATPGTGFLAFNTSNPSRLYGIGSSFSSFLQRYDVTANGITAGSTTSIPAGGPFVFSSGRLYLSNGRIFDAESGASVGTFTGAPLSNVTPFAVDQNVQRAYFLTSTASSTNGTGTATIHVFDTQTFVPIGSISIPNVVGVPTKLVRWGTNGLAFCSTGGVAYMVQTTLVPSADPIPTPTPTPTSSPTPSPTPPLEPSFVRVLPVPASDLIYDSFRQRLYASTPSLAGSIGNSVVPIDPLDGSLGTPISVGSEPNKLARSDDGQFLYVGLDGSNSVRRVDLSTQTASIQFSLGHNAVFGTPNLAADIEVAPGNAHEVAVAMRSASGSPSHQGVAIFDDGVSRGPVDRSQTQSNVIEFSSPSTLLGLDTDTSAQSKFRKMSVTPTGVGSTQAYSLFFSLKMEYDSGRVYTNSGDVVDPDLPAKIGTFKNVTGFNHLVLPDSSVGRTFFITGADASNSNTPQANVQISAFDQNIFLPVGVVNISGVVGGVRSFVRWGVNGLAFSTNSGQVFLVQTTLVSAGTPVPTPTPTPSPTPSPSPIPTPGVGELVQISLTTNDLAVDPNTQTIFASVPSNSGNNPNTLTPINPVSGSLGTAIPVGNNPNKLAMSDNGSLIYVSLDGSNSIRQVDVPSRQAGVEFSLGGDPVSGPYQAEDMSVAPDHPETLAVSRFKPNTSPRSGGVVIYDNGVLRGSTIPGGANNRVEFSRSAGVLYGQNNDDNFDFRFRRIGLASCGAQTLGATENLFRGFGLDFKVDSGRAYASSGTAIDPEAGTITGVFKLRAVDDFFAPPALIAPEVKAKRIYYLVPDGSLTVLRVYDTSTFLKVGELLIPGVSGTASSLVRWGTNGLAFRTSNGQVFLLQNNLIGGTDPQFVPGPIPVIPTTQMRVHMVAPLADPAGFTISLSGGLSLSALTNASGDVTFPNVPICTGSVTVTPSKAGFVFSPASITVSNPVNANLEFTGVLSLVGFTGATDRSVSESVNKVNFTVTRNNNFPTPTSVTFETVPGNASDRSDFNTTTGVIVFGPGETQKNFSVLVTDDALDESNESFIVRLKDPVGGELVSSAATINITILDNDSDPDPPNPLFNASFLVRQHYQDFLNRAATDDPVGFNFWTNEITICNSESDPGRKSECLAVKRINVSAAFFLSIEFQQTGYLVHRFYTSSFPVKPSRPLGLPRMLEFQRDTQAIGSGVVVGTSGWEAKLEQNKQAFALSWVAREEFIADHPLSQSAGDFVDSLFQNNGVSPTSLERSSAINAFGSGSTFGRANALRTVAESQSVLEKQNNPAFVLMQYFGYLRRNPDDAPDGNFSGYQFWLNKLNQFNGNFVNAEMVKAFLVSSEYQGRFGSANFDIGQ